MVASILLDASQFQTGTPAERLQYSKSLLEQLSKNGFARIRNHGVDSQRVEEAFEWGKRFFALPLEEKRKVLNPPGPRPQRGWSTLGAEKTSTLYGKLMGHSVAEDLKDAREHFDFGAPEDNIFESRWPDEATLPGFRAHLEDFFQICEKLSLEIMQALEEAMGVPEGTFRQQCIPNASEFRINHYPAMSAKALEDSKVERIWPHYDLGVITLLFTDCVGGLEFEDRERPKEFIQVEQVDKTDLIVNISETMEHWTAKALPAGLHRVTSPKDAKLDSQGNGVVPERYSIAYFCKAARQAYVMPLGPFQGDHPVDAKETMTALEFQQKRLLTAY